MKMY